MKVTVHRIPQSSPDDVSGFLSTVKDLDSVVAVLGKTEGNGCVNDFTRGYCIQSLKAVLPPSVADRAMFCISGGTEGVLSPHINVFCKTDDDPTQDAKGPPRFGLVVGVHHTADIPPQEIGSVAMLELVAEGVRIAMKEAGLDVANVHFVQVKCPLDANASDPYKSMAQSRSAASLGVAWALGELTTLPEASEIGHNFDLYSSVASTSSGLELLNCEILVMGNSPTSYSDCSIRHSVMQHALDTAAVRDAVGDALDDDENRIVQVFCKGEAAPTILGCRTTMLQDSDISHTRMIRAVVAATVASTIQHPMVYVSGGAEHQGPLGGGPIAAIVRHKKET